MFLKILLAISFIFGTLLANEKGEKIYNILCDKKAIKAIEYNSTSQLIKQIKEKNYCQNIDDKKLQLVALHLTDNTKTIKVPKNSKCQVCGMFIEKYPKWTTSLEDKDGKILYFDGVKDLMKFYFEPQRFSHKKKEVKEMLVKNYYTLQPINAKKAWYVTGSNIYGPMGSELIPFETKEEAKSFLNEHHGQKIVKFSEIDEELVYSLK